MVNRSNNLKKEVHPDTLFGRSYPLGATVYPAGVNFSIYSKSAHRIELLLFDYADDGKPSRIIELDPGLNKTFYYWHVFVPGIGTGQLYGYRAFGPFAPEKGYRFDASKILIDPYAFGVAVGKNYDREAAIRPGDNCAYAMKSVVVDTSEYDWEDDIPLRTDYAVTVIYEMHVGGFSRHPSSGVSEEKRGTYAGFIEKIPYLQDLGITAVELLPVQQFDEQDVQPPLKNYWGYNPAAFFAPHFGYSSEKSHLGPVNEFRDMVKALHKAGIEVILDVVFNHTAEGNHTGPTQSFRGLENDAYYILGEDKSRYANYSGTGNSVNANHSVVRRLILDCLRHWVAEMHVDGFRFDLASVMSRGRYGQPLDNPPILWAIESTPELAGTKIIAEAWDAAGLYQVGSFVGDRWAEWNGHYRDDVRRFVKGDNNTAASVANRIMGSPDIYKKPTRNPNHSINFNTCHDGFTLNDLVSYNEKHNDANEEKNRDGSNHNCSWNCGVEGPTDDPKINELRLRQIKNFLTILFVSQGTPMVFMGDEIRRTQMGNNNAYCQDNELSWFNWNEIEKNADLLRFFKSLIHFTQSRPIFSQEKLLASTKESGESSIIWHGTRLGIPDWSETSHCLAFTLHHRESDEHLHILLNAFWKPLAFELPKLETGRTWRRIVNTALPSPKDFCEFVAAPVVNKDTFDASPRSVVVLMME